MLQNYCDLEKKLIDNYDTSQETSLSSLSNIGSNTTSDLTCFADCQTYIQQQKQLIQQIHKQEKKLKHISKNSAMNSISYNQKLSKSTVNKTYNYSPSSNLLLIKPTRSDSYSFKKHLDQCVTIITIEFKLNSN